LNFFEDVIPLENRIQIMDVGAAAINEITSMVNRTAENAKESTNVATGASQKTESGQKTMERLVNAMETIQESNNQLQSIAEIICNSFNLI
jgi:methyl-accepting chemotaxis protein